MTLARGLRQAGCSYAIHLDMNAGHCGFVFTDVVDLVERRYQLQKASDAMQISADKYVYSSAKDFFYVMVRDPVPEFEMPRSAVHALYCCNAVCYIQSEIGFEPFAYVHMHIKKPWDQVLPLAINELRIHRNLHIIRRTHRRYLPVPYDHRLRSDHPF